MKTKSILFLAILLLSILAFQTRAFAASAPCWVMNEMDTTLMSTPGYVDSLRGLVRGLQSSFNCPMEMPLDFPVQFEPSVFKRQIRFDTPQLIFPSNDAAVKTIRLNSILTFNAVATTVIGNFSPEAVLDENVADLYVGTNAGLITADYDYVVMDLSQFEPKDENWNENLLPLQCGTNSQNIYFRNMIFVLPQGYTTEDFLGTGLNGGIHNKTSCFKNAGDTHFCAGTLKPDSNGNLKDPNFESDWCDEFEPVVEGCDETDLVTLYRDGDGDGWGKKERVPAIKDLLTVNINTKKVCPDDVASNISSGWSTKTGDCNDSNFNIKPTASETCDSVDNNCDGVLDGASVSGDLKTTYYSDSDSDGFGTSTSSVQACVQPAGFVTDHSDCNDGNDQIFPGASEICDGVDNNCNGSIDDAAIDVVSWYQDVDNDTFGNKTIIKTACSKPAGYVADKTDCDDSAKLVKPTAVEVCDQIDNDCDGKIDAADPDLGVSACKGVVKTDKDLDGYRTDVDCDDNDADIHPEATEVCDGVDNNCDAATDEGDVCEVPVTDADEDGFTSDVDCDDENPDVNPGTSEICENSTDDNCDDIIDAQICVSINPPPPVIPSNPATGSGCGCSFVQATNHTQNPLVLICGVMILFVACLRFTAGVHAEKS